MTQRIFDVENEKDMADLWDIFPDDIIKITPSKASNYFYGLYNDGNIAIYMLKINWHDKREITRPIQEATEQDIGKICVFWDDNPNSVDNIGILTCISDCYSTLNGKVEFEKHRYQCGGISWKHCRRLTLKDIKKLC